MSMILNEKIMDMKQLTGQIYQMTVRSAYVAENAAPGQFVNIKCGDGIDALLRRPISICSVNKETGSFNIVFQVKGTGTEILSRKNAGDSVDILAPLGKGFHLPEKHERIAVVGGGIGIFPLLYLLGESQCAEKTAFMGFRSSNYIVLTSEFRDVADSLYISTDDGSAGYGGLVTDLLENELAQKKYDIIYTCGPMPMIRKVADIADKSNIRCQVSMEQRMGCGIGACLVCACKTRHGDDWNYSHVCKDGPVFWSHEIAWEEK